MIDIDKKRQFVADLYPGEGWKKKVKRMPDSQIIAIYMSEKDKQDPKPKKPKESGDDGTPF